jgi:hypothetical protein
MSYLGTSIQEATVENDQRRPKTYEEVEMHKKNLKRSLDVIEKNVELSIDLPDALPTAQLADILGAGVNHRDLLSAAVSSHLTAVVSGLLELGFRNAPKGKPRPRAFDLLAWESLEAAEHVCGLPKIVLLRACLALLARKGVTRVDLQATLDEIGELRDRLE